MVINWKKLDVPGCKPENPITEENNRLKKSKAGYIGGHKRRMRKK